MTRPTPAVFFRQSLKSAAYHADEVINIFLLRPIAAMVVWLVYPTRITPNQLTVTAIIVGCLAASVYALNTPGAIAVAGLLVTAKDILDDADGQLARAKQQYSRRGRFLDSIGDFVVDILLFSAITYAVYQTYPTMTTIVLGAAGFFGITLRVSYHVYYQASFLHLEETYRLNRIIEHVTDEDRLGDPVALRLQMIFNVLYTWQDTMMYRIDQWCKSTVMSEDQLTRWYTSPLGLRISGLLGFGTEFALLTVCSVCNALHGYLLLNVVLMNGIWLTSIAYRRRVLSRRLRSSA